MIGNIMETSSQSNPQTPPASAAERIGPPPPIINERPAPPKVNLFRYLQTILGVAALIATLYTIWTPATLLSGNLARKLTLALEFQEEPVSENNLTPRANVRPRIGIVAGHWGNDSGAVCSDGLEEVKVNLAIASYVKENLAKEGYEVDLLEEFDPRLQQYKANVLVSIHNDSCDFINDSATGYKVAPAMYNPFPDNSQRLTDCLINRYGQATGMKYDPHRITNDMTMYHAFQEIDSGTAAAIIETGYLNLDREILTGHPELVAQGVTNGILCYLRNESIATPESTQTPLP